MSFKNTLIAGALMVDVVACGATKSPEFVTIEPEAPVGVQVFSESGKDQPHKTAAEIDRSARYYISLSTCAGKEKLEKNIPTEQRCDAPVKACRQAIFIKIAQTGANDLSCQKVVQGTGDGGDLFLCLDRVSSRNVLFNSLSARRMY